jgi:hypothetical protein
MQLRTRYLALVAVPLVLAALPARAQTSGFVLAEGPGKLVDALIAAGYGSLNLYDALVDIEAGTNPSVYGTLTPLFLQTVQSCPASSAIFTTHLSAYAGSGVVVYADCTVQTTSLQPSGFNGLAGTTTLSTAIIGVSAPAAMISLSPAYALDPTHSVFGILYAPQGTSQTFVLSDEAPGHLIANLVAAGYGNYNVYDALVAIQQQTNPSLAGVITTAFLANLQSCAAGDPLFTVPLKNLSYSGSGIAVSDDCSVQIRSVQGSSFNGQPGTTSLAVTISGVGSATDVASTSSTPLTSWTQNVAVGGGTATVTYNVFAILYTPGSTPLASSTSTFDAAFQVSYAANPSAGESLINMINTGANGDPLLGPGFGGAAGNTCVNVYAFDPAEELIACCSCLLTPNQVVNLGVNANLTIKSQSGVVPPSVTIKLLNTLAGPAGTAASCTNSAAYAGQAGYSIVSGLVAYGTTPQSMNGGASYNVVEHPFIPATLSAGELASITGRCASIIGNASGYGICTQCQPGALGAGKR